MNNHDLISALRASGRQSMPPASRDRMQQALLQAHRSVTFQPAARSNHMQGFVYHLSPRSMIATAIIAIVMAASVGTTAVADSAKPGDFLFGWDQAAERVRATLTFSETAKAEYESRVAEERLRERLELEAKNSEHAEDARERAERALEQALESVSRVRLKLEAKNNGEAAAALERVELRLRSMNAGNSTSQDGSAEIKAEIEGQRAKIKVEYGLNRWEFTINETTVDAIVAAIVSRTGLTDAEVRAVLRIERSGDDEDERDDDNANGNRNTNASDDDSDDASDDSDDDSDDDRTNTNRSQDDDSDDDSDDDDRTTNTNQSRNTNSSSDDSDDEPEASVEIRVEVNLEDAKTEIRTKVNGQEQEWELATTSQAQILASISAKTGLTNSQITSVWDYEVE